MNGITAGVVRCTVSQCAYNIDSMCHTPAITVGEGADPVCDTFLCDVCVKPVDKGGLREAKPQVGACKVRHCEHNRSLECAARAIVVDVERERPSCDTFIPRDGNKSSESGNGTWP